MDDKKLLPKEQRGCCRGTKGCKDHLLLSKALVQDCKRKKRNLSMAWIDYQKAFGKVPHGWIIKSLELLGINDSYNIYQKGYDYLENTHAPTNRK